MTGYTRSYSRHHPGKYGLMIDWETSGSDFDSDVHQTAKKYQGLAFGAIVFDLTTFEPVQRLYRELQFDAAKYKWTEGAEKIHGLSREHLAKNGMSREEALADLIEMLIKYWPPGFFAVDGNVPTTKILMAGHNAEFDRAFTGQLFVDHDMTVAFHHVSLDTTQICFAVSGVYKSDDVFLKFAGVDKRQLHNALEDAEATLTAMRTMRQLFQLGLSAVDGEPGELHG